jgi:hypothetical protein
MTATEDNLGAALRDFALDQIAHADLQLARAGAWQHEGVHLARKALARLRACLQLLRKSPLAAPALEHNLREFAHGLSTLRDTQAALATARQLRDRAQPRDIWQAQVGALKQQRNDVLAAALMSDPGFAEHRSEIARQRPLLAAIPWTRLLPHDLLRGLKRCVRRTQRARAPARGSTAQAPRHRLRRRTRRLFLQINLLLDIAGDATRPRAASAARVLLREAFGKSTGRKRRKRLVDKLGWEQDLRVLRRALPQRATSSTDRLAVTVLRREQEQAQSATNKALDLSRVT